MKIRTSAHAIAAAFIIAASANASAGLPGLSLPGLGSSSSTAAPVDVDGFLKNTTAAEQLMRTSLDHLVTSLASKEEVAKLEAMKKQAAEKTDSKEKGAADLEVQKSQAAVLNSLNYDQVASENVKKMDAKQKQKLSAAAINFVLATLKDKELLEQSSGMLSNMSSNPANLSKLGTLKDAASSLKNQLELAGSLATKVPKVFSAVGVKNPPTKASDAPVAFSGD